MPRKPWAEMTLEERAKAIVRDNRWVMNQITPDEWLQLLDHLNSTNFGRRDPRRNNPNLRLE